VTDDWRSTACILCSVNCGIEVRTEGRRITRIRGDKAHPTSRGYTCEKALRLDHYQSSRDRLTSPLRRRPDGTYEEIGWDTAIAEVAAGFARVRDAHGGESILYYGGGGQGNHLGGGFGAATRAAIGSRYASNALAQEKTGEFWVDGQLFGRTSCHTTGDYEHAEVAVFVGKNPWQSHGFPRARTVLKEIARDPERALIIIDPRATETAQLADYHLQVRPGTDAWLLAAMLAVLVEEDLVDHAWLGAHGDRYDELCALLGGVDVAAYCATAGVDEALTRAATRRIAGASSVSIYEDLGIQQAPHSTLNSWLEKLVYLVTGNFGTAGAMNIHTRFGSLGGGRGSSNTSPVGGHRIISGLIPAAAIPEEILTDHPRRFRALLCESANPVHSLPDSRRMRAALDALEFVVVVDVAFTETARHADYVLPAASQFEKWEATFFTLEFPDNAFQLRAPLFEPLPGTLPEPEIHRRLVRALGGYTDDDLAPLHDAAARGRAEFGVAFLTHLAEHPEHARYAPLFLYETLGPTLVDEFGPGAETVAAIWGLAQTAFVKQGDAARRAGFADAEALFDAIARGRSGVVFSRDPYEETYARIATTNGRVNLVVDDLVDEFRALATDDTAPNAEYPFVLSAGERRSSTANTIFRDPSWRKNDQSGALRINPTDAARLGVADGGQARVTTARGEVIAVVECTEMMQAGHVSLPNGLGLDYPGDDGRRRQVGTAPNELTSTESRDWLAGTPWHKHVPARVEAVHDGEPDDALVGQAVAGT
jgi:anaerobic selenocysteine-containing dehydrogenase